MSARTNPGGARLAQAFAAAADVAFMTAPARNHVLLIVDDEACIRTALGRALRGEAYEIVQAASALEALSVLRSRTVDLIISDHSMPGMTGLELLRMARVLQPDTLRIIITGYAEVDMAVRAINEDAVYRFLQKPWDLLDLKVVLRLACRHLDAERRNTRLLTLLRKQSQVLERLEREHPDIFTVDRDEQGAIVIHEDLDENLDVDSVLSMTN